MHSAIIERVEAERGCGRRKKGGLYLVSDKEARDCGKMPVPFEVCPCCGGGVKPSRAPVWIAQPERLWADLPCVNKRSGCNTCPLAEGSVMGAALLLWVGEKFYPNPHDFTKEAALMGISRRIKSVPQGFVVGETWVLLAHRKAIALPVTVFSDPDSRSHQPGLFRIFLPARIEVICDGTETDEQIEGYLARGLTPVKPIYPNKKEVKPQDDTPDWTQLL